MTGRWTWNYRVLRHDRVLAIHEVYYDDKGHPTGHTWRPSPVVCDKSESIQDTLRMMRAALAKPVLTSKDFPKKRKHVSRKPLPIRAKIARPVLLAERAPRPKTLVKTTVEQLCQLASVPIRVTGFGMRRTIFLVEGRVHFGNRARTIGTGARALRQGAFDAYIAVGVGSGFSGTRVAALRVLEILARSFDEYCATETVCDQGFFCPDIQMNWNGRISLARTRTSKTRTRGRASGGVHG